MTSLTYIISNDYIRMKNDIVRPYLKKANLKNGHKLRRAAVENIKATIKIRKRYRQMERNYAGSSKMVA